MPNMLMEISEEIAPGGIKRNQEAEPKQKHPVVDVTGDGGKVQCYEEQCCIGT